MNRFVTYTLLSCLLLLAAFWAAVGRVVYLAIKG